MKHFIEMALVLLNYISWFISYKTHPPVSDHFSYHFMICQTPRYSNPCGSFLPWTVCESTGNNVSVLLAVHSGLHSRELCFSEFQEVGI